MLHKEAELEEMRAHSEPPQRPERYELPAILKAYAHPTKPGEKEGGGVLARPSTVTGAKYDEVAKAYIRTLHSVLEGKVQAPAAAAALEKEPVEITGFVVGKP